MPWSATSTQKSTSKSSRSHASGALPAKKRPLLNCSSNWPSMTRSIGPSTAHRESGHLLNNLQGYTDE